jgi:hypothetical protein
MRSLVQRLGSTPVVAGDPALDGAFATAEGGGDIGGGVALDDADNGLVLTRQQI